MSSVTEVGSLYSTGVGFVYVFNLIVGAGVLAMPKAFGDVGWAVGLALLCSLAFMSFVTSTMMVEAMAAANAVFQLRKQRQLALSKAAPTERSRLLPSKVHQQEVADLSSASLTGAVNPDEDSLGEDSEEVNSIYRIQERVEMGTMAKLFFNKVGITFYYLTICIYLYGDLAIYAVAIPKALVNVTCWRSPHHDHNYTNTTGNGTVNATYGGYSMYYGDVADDEYNQYSAVDMDYGLHDLSNSSTSNQPKYCFGHVTDHRAYWIFLGIFALILGPFTFFDLQKTKIMQLATTVLRWLAFVTMIALAGQNIARNGAVHLTKAGSFRDIPSMFGVSVYSFMCQHSLPSLVTPIRRKKRISLMLLGDFSLVLVFYTLVNFTAVFSFPQESMQDLYSNNFNSSIAPLAVSYFLRLFPVIVLSTNFPIISITLRNNLKSLFLNPSQTYSFTVEKLVFPIAALLPPFIIAFATQNLEDLVGYTGSYAGVGVQYLIPIALVYCARKQMPAVTGGTYNNIHRSAFFHTGWLIFVLVWSGACLTINTVNHIMNRK